MMVAMFDNPEPDVGASTRSSTVTSGADSVSRPVGTVRFSVRRSAASGRWMNWILERPSWAIAQECRRGHLENHWCLMRRPVKLGG